MLGRPWGAATLSRWSEWWYVWKWDIQDGPFNLNLLTAQSMVTMGIFPYQEKFPWKNRESNPGVWVYLVENWWIDFPAFWKAALCDLTVKQLDGVPPQNIRNFSVNPVEGWNFTCVNESRTCRIHYPVSRIQLASEVSWHDTKTTDVSPIVQYNLLTLMVLIFNVIYKLSGTREKLWLLCFCICTYSSIVKINIKLTLVNYIFFRTWEM